MALVRILSLLACLFVVVACVAPPSATGGFAANPARGGAQLTLDVTAPEGARTGSAVAIGNGLALTAAHVLGPQPDRIVAARTDGTRVTARLLVRSPRMDLAVLAIPADFTASVPLRTAPIATGESLTAHGVTPQGRGAVTGPVIESQAKLTGYGNGFVTRLGAVQGYSGGPMLDSSGQLAGLTVALRAARADIALAAAQPLRGQTQGASSNEVFALSAETIAQELARLLP